MVGRREADDREMRVVVLAPTGRDASLTSGVLERAGIQSVNCPDVASACTVLEQGAAALLLAEEAATSHSTAPLVEWLSKQRPWSDLPILVLARPGADSESVARAMDLLGNVTVLERPMRVASMVSAVRSAMRARLRQYQIRQHLLERERAEQALHEADRRKNEFLAVLAHELRNPLAPIRSGLQILRQGPVDRDVTERLSEMMNRQVTHLVRLVDDLLEISRITRDRLDLRREQVSIVSVLQSAVEASRPHIDLVGHQLEMSVPKEPLLVHADPVRLAQVFTNLLNNAAKFTAPNGRISMTVSSTLDRLEVVVRDNGSGIASDRLVQIFELFVQLDTTADRVQSGLGIGLTLVKRLVEMHGGAVEARSAGIGHGSEFVVTLPRVIAPASAAHTEVAGESTAARSSRKVLVVDDNRDAADTLADVLRLRGAQVEVVYNGPDALRVIERDDVALALVDIGMPGMSGYDVARHVRANMPAQPIVLVALTGWGQEADIDQAHDSGFAHHLIKPADIAELYRLLDIIEGASAATQ